MTRLATWPTGALAGTFALSVAALMGSALVGSTAGHMAGPMRPVEDDAAALRPATTVAVVSCSPLPHVPGKSITTAVVTFPPGAYSPRHRHPGSVTAYVLEGTIRSQLAGGEPGMFVAGQGWFEPPGVVHLLAENPSDRDVARLLAVFVADQGCGPLVIPEKP